MHRGLQHVSRSIRLRKADINLVSAAAYPFSIYTEVSRCKVGGPDSDGGLVCGLSEQTFAVPAWGNILPKAQPP